MCNTTHNVGNWTDWLDNAMENVPDNASLGDVTAVREALETKLKELGLK